MSKVASERLYQYARRLIEGEEFEKYLDNIPVDRRSAKLPYDGANKRQVIDLRYKLGRVMPVEHDFSVNPTDPFDFTG